ncbi:MAG: hypothetical protein FJW23_09070 [Acidimicrobiia bacterium]|nr:hypothetical protein [Acidimicrobiia bacterium]
MSLSALRTRVFAAAAAACALVLGAGPAWSEDAPGAERALPVLLDVSGSMRESVAGGVKHNPAGLTVAECDE